jgi:hypothetical protein
MGIPAQESYEEYEKLVAGGCDVESLSYAAGVLHVTVIAHPISTAKIRVVFERALSFRVMDEREKMRIWAQFTEPASGRMFMVRESSYVSELASGSCGIIQADHFRHYMIATDNDCVDVVCHESDLPKTEGA